jgi:hypothetical protein
MTGDNVRLVDADGNVDSSWHVEPGDTKRAEWSVALLHEYRDAEPRRDWHLQTRGTVAGWHRWDVPEFRKEVVTHGRR